MREPSSADLYLARLAARTPYRWTIYTVFALTATAILYQRIVLGRSEQALPWQVGLLALYGFGMAVIAQRGRSRIIYGCFGLLIAVAFTRTSFAGWTRLAGVVELSACLTLLAAFMGLSREPGPGERLPEGDAVLESGTSRHRPKEEGSDG